MILRLKNILLQELSVKMSLSKSLKNGPCNIFYGDVVSLHVSIQKISVCVCVCVCVSQCAVYSLRNVTPLP